ncbi:hypothetical protein [Microbacterium soli]
MHPALLYLPGGRLSLAELGSARLDGHVVEIGEGFMPADTVEEADARAAGVAVLIPAHMAACGATAAWIHGAGDGPPALHHVRRMAPTRGRVTHSPRMVYHERRIDPDEVQRIAGVAVTTPLATAAELVYSAALRGTGQSWLHALIRVRPGLMDELCERLERTPRRPGRRRALGILTALAAQTGAHDGQEEVTR